jgi:hypothetical protein
MIWNWRSFFVSRLKVIHFMRNILIYISFLFTIESFSQGINAYEIDSISISIGKDLIKDSFNQKVLIYQTGCVGCFSNGSCRCIGSHLIPYIIWQTDTILRIKKLNCCKDETNYEILASNNIWSEYDSKLFNSKFNSSYYTSHAHFYSIILIDKKEVQKIEMFDYYFEENNKFKTQNETQAAFTFLEILREMIGKL